MLQPRLHVIVVELVWGRKTPIEVRNSITGLLGVMSVVRIKNFLVGRMHD